MRHRLFLYLVIAAVLGTAWMPVAHAARKTVCSITVNSADERETFRRYLPQEEFDFVELVERGRPDWLGSACRRGVECDVLLISGHFDGGTEFYSDRLDARESLPVAELERASCSASCAGLFARLKEVYLFGCNTLNAEPLQSASGEIGRSLLRAGHSPNEIAALIGRLEARHGESNREVMRHIFKDVPVIYGFSGKAPLGRFAAATLERYFQPGAPKETASGRPDPRLVGLFAPVSMTVAAGMTDSDPHASYRRDACQFADDARTLGQKAGFVHELLGRDTAEVRLSLDRVEKFAAAITGTDRSAPDVSAALDAIRSDTAARGRFMEFARDADRADVRARMLAVARAFDWLDADAERAELLRMFGERLSSNRVGPAEVELACRLNGDGRLGAALDRLRLPAGPIVKAAHAAVLACLGNPEARERVLQALTSPEDADVQIAQVYLGHRPVTDPGELRQLAAAITRMSGKEAQVLALEALSRHPLADSATMNELIGLFGRTRVPEVQRAVAGILIRADYRAIATPEVVQAFRLARIQPATGTDAVDILIRRMELAIGDAARVAGS